METQVANVPVPTVGGLAVIARAIALKTSERIAEAQKLFPNHIYM